MQTKSVVQIIVNTRVPKSLSGCMSSNFGRLILNNVFTVLWPINSPKAAKGRGEGWELNERGVRVDTRIPLSIQTKLFSFAQSFDLATIYSAA